MATLPSDILLEEIFPKLPARSLTRFKCVSKSFKILISSPEFIQRHLHHSRSSDGNRLLIVDDLCDNKDSLRCFDIESPKSPPSILPFPRIPGETIKLVDSGPCNGLLLIEHVSKSRHVKLTVLNPSTGVYVNIELSNPEELRSGCPIYALGYDSLHDDYKVMRILDEIILIEVYSLKKQSWRTLEWEPKEIWVHCLRPVLIANRFLHLSITEVDRYVIKRLDFCTESWIEDFLLPDFCDAWNKGDKSHKGDRFNIGELDGHLTIITLLHNEGFIRVWLMKEYGVKESWIPLLGISDICVTKYPYYNPLAFRRGSTSEILLRRNPSPKKEFSLSWYNIKDKIHHKTTDDFLYVNQNYQSFKPIVCHGTLVTIPFGKVLGFCNNNNDLHLH